MEHIDNLSVKEIENAIVKGAKYLLCSLNRDNGIKYEDEKSSRSGIWVTAEVLEFFLSTRSLPIVAYNQIEPMIKYLLSQQNTNDGSYTILSQNANHKDEASTISTGHCTYVLKLALRDGFLDGKFKQKITNAVEKGEQWLRSCCIERDGYAFWGTRKILECDPNADERTRIEYIFDTYYAIMGLSNPYSYPENSEKDKELIRKTRYFFSLQANWFLEHYGYILSGSKVYDFSNVTSTFCRIINVSHFLGENIIDRDSMNKFKQILARCSQNPFITTKIVVETHLTEDTGATYTNNTPFDMGMALMNLCTEYDIIKRIIRRYLDEQNSIDGFWYLNFNSSYKIKTWSTAEALLVLEKALRIYKIIEIEEESRLCELKYETIKSELDTQNKLNIQNTNRIISELQEQKSLNIQNTEKFESENNKQRKEYDEKMSHMIKKNKHLFNILLISAVPAIIFAIAICLMMVFIITDPEYKDKPLAGILGYMVIPSFLVIITQVPVVLIGLFKKR